MRIAIVVFVALSMLAAAPAYADQVRFTGNTTADPTLIKDALQNILRFAFATQNCSSLEAVQSSLLPKYRPKDALTRPEQGKGAYESWTATLCGKPTKFLLTFWPAEQGGTMFAVTHPYPQDAP